MAEILDPPLSLTFTNLADLVVEVRDAVERSDVVLATMQVSAAALRMASPVWNKMLDDSNHFSQLREREVDGRKMRTLLLYEVDIEALRCVFDVIHYRYSSISTQPSFRQLVELAKVCDVYDCARVVTPWIENWTSEANMSQDQDGDDEPDLGLADRLSECTLTLEDGHNSIGKENWLYIEEVLKFKPTGDFTLINISLDMAQDICAASHRGNAATYYRYLNGPIAVDLSLVPEKIIDHILRERQKAVYGMLFKLKEFLSVMDITSHTARPREGRVCQNDECFDIAHGSLTRSLKEADMWQICVIDECDPRKYGLSVKNLRQKIQRIRMTTIAPPASEPDHKVSFCSKDHAFHTALRSTFVHDPYCDIPGGQSHMCPALKELRGLFNRTDAIYCRLRPYFSYEEQDACPWEDINEDGELTCDW